MPTKIIKENLETWKGGKATGYYEPFLDEIHLLRGEVVESRTLAHERVHASRVDKATFKFASLIAVPAFTYMLFGILLVLAVVGVFTSIVPFFVVAAVSSGLLLCHAYEEYVADILVLKWQKDMKIIHAYEKYITENGGETQK